MWNWTTIITVIVKSRPKQWNLASDLLHTFQSVILRQYSFGHLDTSVMYQLPCPVSPEISTKQIGQSEGSIWYAHFKVLYSNCLSWPLRPLHLTNQKKARNAQVTPYSIWYIYDRFLAVFWLVRWSGLSGQEILLDYNTLKGVYQMLASEVGGTSHPLQNQSYV